MATGNVGAESHVKCMNRARFVAGDLRVAGRPRCWHTCVVGRAASNTAGARASAPIVPRTSGTLCAAVLDALEAGGLNGTKLALEAGLTPESLRLSGARVPAASELELLRLALKATGDPAFGLRVADFVHPGTFHVLLYAGFASATAREAFLRLVRFSRVLGDNLVYALEEHGEDLFVIGKTRGRGSEYAVIEDTFLCAGVRLAPMFIQDDSVRPVRVLVARPEGPLRTRYEEALGAPVVFCAPFTALVFRGEAFARPLPGRNETLAAEMDRVLAAFVEGLEPESVASRATRTLTETLAVRSPSKERLSRALGMSARSLQRRLAEEGTSFRAVVDEARHAIATQHLRAGDLSVTEVAARAGFDSLGAFSRAFRRWTGSSPQGYRAGAFGSFGEGSGS